MKLDKVEGFEICHANLNNKKPNTPPSKRQKLSERDHQTASIILQLKSQSHTPTPKSHESNCYRALTNFVGCLIDDKLSHQFKVQTLQSNVRDLIRIYGKSADLYNFILREVRRGLAGLKPQSFDQQRGYFIHRIIRIWTRVDNWMVCLIDPIGSS